MTTTDPAEAGTPLRTTGTGILAADNPFARPSTLPYGLPDYAAVRVEHYLPALLAGMAQQRAEVEAVAADPAPPTVENTLEALERSGRLLHRAASAFYHRLSSDTTSELDRVEEQVAPLLAAHSDAIYQDSRLEVRVRTLLEEVAAGSLMLDEQTDWLLRRWHLDLVRAGVHLEPAAQARLRELNGQITQLDAEFGRTLLAAQNAAAVLVTDAAELAGLGAEARATARAAARREGHEEGWLIELQLPTHQPVLAELTHRPLRERVYRASAGRGDGGEHDTRPILLAMARLRAERARLLGFEHHAAYVAADETAGSADAVAAMLTRLAPAAVANARREQADLQAALSADAPGATLEPWDWAFYEQRVRRERRQLDEAALRPYLSFERVLAGVLAAANALYGLTFAQRHDLVPPHPDAQVYEVFDADGSGLGLFVVDPYARPTKRGGAWMSSLVDQSDLLGERAVVLNTANVPQPGPGEPALLSWDFVITLFHEFGHALHGLLSAVRYPSRSGTHVPRDFVEYPSQVNEMWAWDPAVVAGFARHHETGEPMPQEWVDTVLAARADGQGFATTEYLAAALLDQAWHRLTPEQVPTDPDEVATFEARALAAAGVDLPAVPPRYRTTYFNHIFGGGYSAGYYAYIWSEVLDADTVDWFAQNGGLTRANGDTFRRRLLGRGGSIDPLRAFRELRGRDPRIEPLLARRGLAGPRDQA